MNTEDDNEENLSTTKSETEPIAESESLESGVEALPSNTAEDGSGDHLPILETKNTTSERIPECVTRNLTEDISKKPEKICDKDIGISVEKSQQDTLLSKIKEQTATSTDSLEDDIVVLSKSTCLETNSSKVSEELDSENQDEDLVLRWDDDEGDGSRSFKDDEVDKVDQVRDKSMEDLTLNHGPGTEKSQVLTKESTERMDTDLDSVSEKIDNTLDDSTEVLDIDLDEVTQKFEESLKESSEDPDTQLDPVSAKPRQAQQESAEIAEIVIVNDSVKFEETLKENTEVVIPDINQDCTASKPPQEKPELTESAEISDPELGFEKLKTPKSPEETIEIPEIDEDAEMTEVMQKEPAAIDLDQDLEASEVTEKVSAENDDKDNFDQSKVAGMECVEGIELKTSDDDVEEDQDDLLSEIDAQIAELGASLSKAENDKLMNIKTCNQTKTTATKDSNMISLVSSTSPLKEVISIDTNEEIDKIATKDTQDEIVQHTQSQKETSDMDIEDALLADDPDLSIDQNEKDRSPNNSEVLANSTKLDHSFIGDSEMDSACKDDTFAHDSSSSIDGRVHGVNKTNVMLEIPTQELLDLDSLSCESMSGKEMSLDEIKTEEGNVSVDLTDDKDPAEKITKESDEEKPLGENQMNKKVTLESETILNESNLDIGKLTKEDCISKEKVTDTDVEMKIVQEPEVVQKEIEPPETSKDLQIDNQPTAGTSATNNATTIETKADSTTENSLLEDTSTNIDRDIIDVQPSTSQTGLSAQDPSDDAAEVAEVTDSLGLLAESSFVREDDDGDVDDQETSDHDDDDEDFDPDDGKSSQEPSDDAAEVAEVTDSLSLLESSFVREDDDGDVDDQETSDHEDDDDDFDPDDGKSTQEPSDDAAEVAEVTDSLGLLAESSFVREDDDGDVDGQETSDHEDDDDDFDPDDGKSSQELSDDAAEVAEVTDSLGLLAESSFVREDDDGDVDDQETSDHEDDDDDFDPDDGKSTQDPSDDAAEVAEVTDSLGLLAESSFVREDDDGDMDDQETSDHDDDDEDFDPGW
ncbi:hypothetical protein O0L34_g10753 [Tuta absoluta]|nr:hypothetical protein O0L34_g10753 [Tuta absoluta]